jgi:hypothetical protein
MTAVVGGAAPAVAPVSQAYEQLLALARRQQEIVETGRLDELELLLAEWEVLTAALPAPTPDERELLEAIEVIVWSSVATLDKALNETGQTLSLIRRGRKAIGSYAGAATAAPPPSASLNTRG